MVRVLSVWLLMAAVVSPLSAGETKAPNLVFLFADDMRADVIGALGNPHVRTPNLDRLVKRGTSFTRAYILGGNQGAVCVPSRAMMLTGRSMFTIPANIGPTTTWPIQLRRAGYTTFFTGKWHNGLASAVASFPGARNVFLGGMSDQFAVKVTNLPDDPLKLPKKNLGTVAKRHSSELFADEAISFLKQKPKGPFALYVAFTAPHDPREAPKEWHDKFDPAKIPAPPNFMPKHPFDNGEMVIRDEKLEKWPRTKDAIQRHLADYYAIIAHMDAQIGRILDALEASGELDNTIILFAGDNGLAIGSHGLMGKQNVYDHSVRVPLIIGGPGLPKDRKSDALVYLLDLCPTICELTGASVPKDIHGKSLVPLLRGKQSSHRTALLFAYRDVQRGVTDGRWKAIHYPKIDRWQLFDLQSDPHEIHDLIGEPQHGETLTRLRSLMADLRKELGDVK